MRLSISALVTLVLVCLFGCASAPTQQSSTPSSEEMILTRASSTSEADLAQVTVEEILEADEEIEKTDDDSTEPEAAAPFPKARQNVRTPRAEFGGMPIEVNERVKQWIHYFTVRDRERFERYLLRGSEYKPMIQEVLKNYRVPKELYYLALIESGFTTHAVSRASAVGMWQFMKTTGSAYGLRYDSYVDERRHPIRSTHAAARHLRDLHRQFSNWHLAIAAYNAGVGRIRGAIRRGGTRDFWKLAHRGVLPRETMHYIPKFLAAVIIGRNPEKYGFGHVRSVPPFPLLTEVKVSPRTSLASIARSTPLSIDELKKFNPHLRRGMTHVDRGRSQVWVPPTLIARVKEVRPERSSAKPARRPDRRLASAKGGSSRGLVYRVRKGDTLYGISNRFGVSVKALKRTNRLNANDVYAGQKLVIQRRS